MLRKSLKRKIISHSICERVNVHAKTNDDGGDCVSEHLFIRDNRQWGNKSNVFSIIIIILVYIDYIWVLMCENVSDWILVLLFSQLVICQVPPVVATCACPIVQWCSTDFYRKKKNNAFYGANADRSY